MAAVILHPRDLSGCEHRLALDVTHPELGSHMNDTPEAARRIRAAADHRDRVRNLLRGLHSDQPGAWRAIDRDARRSDRIAATRAACEEQIDWIWGATLPVDVEGGRRGDSELLVRVDDGYVPVIVVNHRVSYGASPRRSLASARTRTSPLWGWLPTLDPSRNGRNQRRDQLRLAQIMAMLIDLDLAPSSARQRVQAASAAAPETAAESAVGVADEKEALEPLTAGVIGLDADCIVVYDLLPVMADYGRILERRHAIASGRVLTEPRRIGECRSCPWWGRCEPELEQRRDVSLVASGNQASALAAAGITTIDQLAHHRGDPPDDWPGNVAFTDAVASAVAWLTDTPLIRRRQQPVVARADIEVDVDMESYGESGAYMWGTLLTDNTDPTRPVVYRPFVTWDPLPTDDEARSFAEFWQWLTRQREAAHDDGKTFAAYCYSEQAENRWLLGSADRFEGMPGIPTRAEVEEFIASKEWVDIFEAVGRNFIAPRGKGLKRVAPVAGHRWRDAEAGGEASMDWYREAVALDGGTPDIEQRTRLLEYNEDDVRATKVLREWMSNGAVHDVPLEADLLASRGSGAGRAQGVEEGTAAE